MSKLSKLAFGAFGTVLMLTSSAWAQQVMQTVPSPGTTAGGNASGTIVTTGTFQLVFAAMPNAQAGGPVRKGCRIVNGGTHTMFVSEGLTVATATVSNSIPVAAGSAFDCTITNTALQGQIDIEGTSGDYFYAAQF